MSPAWRSFWRPTTRRCARRTTTWSKRDRSEFGVAAYRVSGRGVCRWSEMALFGSPRAQFGHSSTDGAPEAAARNKIDESRIGPIRVPPRTNMQECEMDVARGIGLLEPLEGPIVLAETGMHERQPSRGDIPFARSLFERP